MAHELTVSRKGWLQSIRDKVMGVFDRWTGRESSQPAESRGTGSWLPMTGAFAFGPAVDVVDDGENLRIQAELPGLSPEEFRVRVDGRRLFLSGERSAKREEQRDGYVIRECRMGAFNRIVPLPCEVDKDSAQAYFDNGVLDLRLPKTKQSKPHRIPVRRV